MKQAGVRIVIENIMDAFSAYSKNKLFLIESGNQEEYQPTKKIKHIKINEIGYLTKCFSSEKEFRQNALKIANKI